MRMVVGQGLKLAMIGVGAGIIVALGTSRALVTMLYEVTPNDPLTFIAVPILFAVVALVACYIPARRGMRVDPLVALRYE
jgi:ABC-type antimicrobial peptide transport system permease subunit